MKIDGINLTEGSVIKNLSVDLGNSFPGQPNEGELFYLTLAPNEGLYIHDGSSWLPITTSGSGLSFTPVNRAGDTMTGALILSSDPTTPLGAATKSYVDSAIQTPTGVASGTYKSVTVDSRGWVTGGSNPSSLAGYGITDAQPLSPILSSISAVSEPAGLLKKMPDGSWILDSSAYLVTNQPITITGDGSGIGNTTIDLSLTPTGVIPGTYGSSTRIPVLTINAAGQIVAASTVRVKRHAFLSFLADRWYFAKFWLRMLTLFVSINFALATSIAFYLLF